MSLVFTTAATPATPDVQRSDVACFVGFVARRAGVPLPDAVVAQLVADGWTDDAALAGGGVRSVWARAPEDIQALLDVPVVVDGWDLFDQLFAWNERPVSPTSDATCATYLGAAVRSFFARGGRRAVIVRVGDPWPVAEDAAQRIHQHAARLSALLPGVAIDATPFAPGDPSTWKGSQHVHGQRGLSLLLLPDLPDACSLVTPLPDVSPTLAPAPEGFVECSVDDPVMPDDSLRNLPAPRLDATGYVAWQAAIAAARDFLATWDRELLLLAALPLPLVDTVDHTGTTHAQADMLAWLQSLGVLRADGSTGSGADASAFVQLAWPWLRTQAASDDLPEGLESPDGVLAGLVAGGALQRGSFRSVAGDTSQPLLRDIADALPVPSWGQGDDNPTARLARHVCLFAQSPDGWALQSDVTTAADEAWRFGGASRLVGAIVRTARAHGDAAAFEPNGPRLWARIRRQMEAMLLDFWNEGAFAGNSAGQAFSVRCDRGTMTQSDIDSGRLIVEIGLRPAASIETITVVLDLGNTGALASGLREAA
jgi:hypothetical protein